MKGYNPILYRGLSEELAHLLAGSAVDPSTLY